MPIIRKINVLSLAKFQALLGALIGWVCGILYAFGGLMIDVLVTLNVLDSVAMSTPGLSQGTILAFGALIGIPLIFSLAGYILGLLEAMLYNLYTKFFGGFG